MTHDIIDNRKEKLSEHIGVLLDNAQMAKFAVGFFFLSGLKPYLDKIEELDELRLLMDSKTDKRTMEALALSYQNKEAIEKIKERGQFRTEEQEKKIAQEKKKVLGNIVANFVEQTDENEKYLKKLIELVKSEKLKVKLYTKETLHAKAYIFDYKEDGRYEKGCAIVGSSNLSLSALESNTELNVVVPGRSNHKVLSNWFDELWEEAVDFDKYLVEVINESWAKKEPTPYEVYLKIVYEIVESILQKEKRGLAKPFEDMPELYRYQKDAVIQGLSVLEQYNGVFISDVVGLGKSYIGGQILVNLEEDKHQKAIIVSPPNLMKMWRGIVDKFNLRARVVSMYQLDKVLDNEILMKRQVVLIDESHRFRHKNTQRYEHLSQICYDKKVILLTATPLNIEPKEVLSQIKLFHPADITDIPISPPNLRKYFKLIGDEKRSLENLLQHILIRRTRTDIKKWYRDDMKRRGLKFPIRKDPNRVDYSIDEVYAAGRKLDESIYKEIRDKLRAMNYARYDLGSYVKKEFKCKPEVKRLKQRGPNLVGLMRVILFKQFESSVAAFRESVGRILKVHRAFKQSLEENIVPVGKQEDLIDILESGEELTKELMKEKGKEYPIKWFKKEKILEKLNEDIETLSEIYEMVEPIRPEQDDKLQRLIKLLNSKELQEKKVLIFTQYTTTAEYLGRQLKNIIRDRRIEFVSGERGDIQKIVERFAPKANLEKPSRIRRGIDILVATDVLSEGQNLQDSNVVINYDLHWNVVKLIQRLGRVDRVTTTHDYIYNYNFFPESKLDTHLDLEERIKYRIKEIQENVGEDAKYLSKDERPESKGFFEVYSESSGAIEEKGEKPRRFSNVALLQFIRNIKKEKPKLFKKIRKLSDRVRTAKKSDIKGFIVFCRTKDYTSQYLIGQSGKVITQDRERILKLLEASPEDKRLELPEAINTKVRKTEEIFREEARKRQTELEASETNPVIRFVLKDLKKYARGANREIKTEISKLRKLLTAGPPDRGEERKLRSLRRKRQGIARDQYLEELTEILENNKNRKKKDKERKKEPIVVEVVASEGLIK